MTKLLLDALRLKPLAPPPVWIMRQAGRYLPEYREVRKRHTFQEVVSTPELAAEVTLQPIRRFGMDGAVIFADIMTPLEAMGVEVRFDPGPKLEPLTLGQVADLPDLDPERVSNIGETIRLVKGEVPETTAVIGFAGAPITLLAYLLEGGGSKEFMAMRSALHAEPDLATAALDKLARSMSSYLGLQVDAGADAVQLFDSWAGLLGTDTFRTFAVPAARRSLELVGAPTIYFAPGAGHTLAHQSDIGAVGYGIDWRVQIGEAFARLPGRAIQGNIDPAVLLGHPDSIVSEARRLLDAVGGRPGHIVNLGHGIDRRTPPENVAAFVEAIRR
ncbi:MAG: uroporphyrinogen decarboxylase [Acidimicrobiia bacterium]